MCHVKIPALFGSSLAPDSIVGYHPKSHWIFTMTQAVKQPQTLACKRAEEVKERDHSGAHQSWGGCDHSVQGKGSALPKLGLSNGRRVGE